MRLINKIFASQYSQGLILRILALAAKLVFVVYIVNFLAEGVYTNYIYLFTIALIAARLLSLGSEEHLPIIVRDDRKLGHQFFPLFLIAFVTSLLFLVLGILASQTWLMVIAIVMQLSGGWILGGLVRSVRPGQYEILLNIPVMLFVVLCLVFPPENLLNLMLIYCASALVVQAVLGWIEKPEIFTPLSTLPKVVPVLLPTMIPGAYKTFSNILVVLNTRAIVVIPAIFLAWKVADSITVAVSIGEAFFQLGMVVVMRNYAAYCRDEGNYSGMIKSSATLFVLGLIAGTTLMFLPEFFEFSKINFNTIGWSFLFMAALLVFMEARYYYWSRRQGHMGTIAVQIVFIALQTLIVLFAPMDWWFAGMSLMSVLFAAFYLLAGYFGYGDPDTSQLPSKSEFSPRE